jgi:hypothetical protein
MSTTVRRGLMDGAGLDVRSARVIAADAAVEPGGAGLDERSARVIAANATVEPGGVTWEYPSFRAALLNSGADMGFRGVSWRVSKEGKLSSGISLRNPSLVFFP